MSPITVSPRAEEVLTSRKTKVQSWYFDITTAMAYWGQAASITTRPQSRSFTRCAKPCASLSKRSRSPLERHRINQQALIAGAEAMGLKMFVENPKDRLVTVTPVMVPAGIDDVKFRDQLSRRVQH